MVCPLKKFKDVSHKTTFYLAQGTRGRGCVCPFAPALEGQGTGQAAMKELWPSSGPNLRLGWWARSNQDLDL